MREFWLFLAASAVVVALPASPAWAQPPELGPSVPAPLTVLQDCWTTSLELDPDPELELYTFPTAGSVDFIWKHKLLVPCSAYTIRLQVYPCRDGKPVAMGADKVATFHTEFGPISPVPGIPELLFAFSVPAASFPPGRFDWTLQTECDDTTGFVRLDGDIDDECGINVGAIPPARPVILGPEPIERFDPDPGGFPPGRGPGEEGTTRPWCFEIVEDPPEAPSDSFGGSR